MQYDNPGAHSAARPSTRPHLAKDRQPMPATAPAHDQAAGPLKAVPPKPEHKVDQLTTAELTRERSTLEAALDEPFAAAINKILQGRLDAVRAEQDERARMRKES
jgi:hypothetical protein